MCDQTEVQYLPGEVVWVKLRALWWPGRVENYETLPEEITSSLKKRPIATVKFFQEDSYEYVHKLDVIYHYNCSKKHEFIKKGLDLTRKKSADRPSNVDLFPSDVVTAELLTGGDPNIIQDEAFKPEEKPKYEALFGGDKKRLGKKKGKEETPLKDKPLRRIKFSTTPPAVGWLSRGSAAKIIRPPSNIPRVITHPRFLAKAQNPDGKSDYEMRILVQKSNEDDARLPAKKYECCICGYSTCRLNVIILHFNSSHSVKTESTIQRTKGAKARSGRSSLAKVKSDGSKSTPKSVQVPKKQNASDVDGETTPVSRGIDAEMAEAETSKDKSVAKDDKPGKRGRKRKIKVASEEADEPEFDPKKPKVVDSLLADWEEDTEQEQVEIERVREQERQRRLEEEAASAAANASKSKEVFEFDDDDGIDLDLTPNVKGFGRRIPRVIDSTKEKKPIPMEVKKSSTKEKQTKKEIKDLAHDVDSILAETSVPCLPSIPKSSTFSLDAGFNDKRKGTKLNDVDADLHKNSNANTTGLMPSMECENGVKVVEENTDDSKNWSPEVELAVVATVPPHEDKKAQEIREVPKSTLTDGSHKEVTETISSGNKHSSKGARTGLPTGGGDHNYVIGGSNSRRRRRSLLPIDRNDELDILSLPVVLDDGYAVEETPRVSKNPVLPSLPGSSSGHKKRGRPPSSVILSVQHSSSHSQPRTSHGSKRLKTSTPKVGHKSPPAILDPKTSPVVGPKSPLCTGSKSPLISCPKSPSVIGPKSPIPTAELESLSTVGPKSPLSGVGPKSPPHVAGTKGTSSSGRPKSPSLLSGPQSSSPMSTPKSPSSSSGPRSTSPMAGSINSSAMTGSKSRPSSAGPKSPLPSAGPKSPMPSSGPKSPLPSAGPKSPLPSAGPKSPLPSAGPKSPLPSAGPKSPLPSAGPKSPLVSAGPKSPEPSAGPKSPPSPAGPKNSLPSAGPKSPLPSAGPKSPQCPPGLKNPPSSAGPKSPPSSVGLKSTLSPAGPKSPQSSTLPKSPQSSTLLKSPQSSTLPKSPQSSTLPKSPPSATGPKSPPSATGPKSPPSATGPKSPPSATGPKSPPFSTGPKSPLPPASQKSSPLGDSKSSLVSTESQSSLPTRTSVAAFKSPSPGSFKGSKSPRISSEGKGQTQIKSSKGSPVRQGSKTQTLVLSPKVSTSSLKNSSGGTTSLLSPVNKAVCIPNTVSDDIVLSGPKLSASGSVSPPPLVLSSSSKSTPSTSMVQKVTSGTPGSVKTIKVSVSSARGGSPLMVQKAGSAGGQPRKIMFVQGKPGSSQKMLVPGPQHQLIMQNISSGKKIVLLAKGSGNISNLVFTSQPQSLLASGSKTTVASGQSSSSQASILPSTSTDTTAGSNAPPALIKSGGKKTLKFIKSTVSSPQGTKGNVVLNTSSGQILVPVSSISTSGSSTLSPVSVASGSKSFVLPAGTKIVKGKAVGGGKMVLQMQSSQSKVLLPPMSKAGSKSPHHVKMVTQAGQSPKSAISPVLTGTKSQATAPAVKPVRPKSASPAKQAKGPTLPKSPKKLSIATKPVSQSSTSSSADGMNTLGSPVSNQKAGNLSQVHTKGKQISGIIPSPSPKPAVTHLQTKTTAAVKKTVALPRVPGTESPVVSPASGNVQVLSNIPVSLEQIQTNLLAGASPSESGLQTPTQQLVTVSTEDGGQVMYLIDNSALLGLDGSTQAADGSPRTLIIDPASLAPSQGNLGNLILTFDNVNVAQPSVSSSDFTFTTPSSGQDILAEALANTQVLQPDTAGSDLALDTSGLLSTHSASALYPSTVPTLSHGVLETSLTLNQPIMTPLQDLSAVSSLQPPPAVPTSIELPITITQPDITISTSAYSSLPIPSATIQNTVFTDAQQIATYSSIPLLTTEADSGSTFMESAADVETYVTTENTFDASAESASMPLLDTP